MTGLRDTGNRPLSTQRRTAYGALRRRREAGELPSKLGRQLLSNALEILVHRLVELVEAIDRVVSVFRAYGARENELHRDGERAASVHQERDPRCNGFLLGRHAAIVSRDVLWHDSRRHVAFANLAAYTGPIVVIRCEG